MILIINWPSDAHYNEAMRHNLAHLCAELTEQGLLNGCIAALPRLTEEHSWFFTFLNSIKRAGVERVNVVMPDTECSSQNMRACESAGLTELIILQDTDRPLPIAPGNAGIRVWFGHDASGRYQNYVCSVKSDPRVLSVEITPFARHASAMPPAVKAKDAPGQLSCNWQRSVLTLSNKGSLTLAPVQHFAPSSPPCSTPGCAIFDYARKWKDKLQLYPICNSCSVAARNTLPAWFGQPDYRPSFVADIPSYLDHTKRDAGTYTYEQKKATIAAFVNRARSVDHKTADQ